MEMRAITHLQIIEDQLIERRKRYIKLKKKIKKEDGIFFVGIEFF